MRSSKKRKIAGLDMKQVTLKLESTVYAKLSQLAGPDSLATTVEKMTEHYHARARNRNISKESSS